MGKAVARPTRTKAERLMLAKRALDLRLSGVDDLVICRELAISRATLFRWIDWAMRQQIDPTVEQYRQEAAARIRESRRRIYETLAREEPVTVAIGGIEVTLMDPETGEPQMAPVCGPNEIAALTGRLVQLEETEAKLRGGFAPTQVNHQVTVSDAFDALLAELDASQPVDRPVPRV